MSTAEPTDTPLDIAARRSASAGLLRASVNVRRLEVVLVVAVAVLVVVLGWHQRWTSDDAFIDFRIVENVLHGDGPVFNPGMRVEAGTSPLWVFLVAGVSLLPGLSIEWTAVLLGLAFTGAGFLFAGLGTRRLLGDRAALVLPFGLLIAACLPAMWDFATSGLETGLIFGWLGLSWWLLVRCLGAGGRSAVVWAAVVVGLGPVVRPDMAVMTAALGIWLLVVQRGWWMRALVVGAGAAVPIGYQIFRMGYFGLLVPNTAIAKESSRALWSRGLVYLLDFVHAYDLYVVVAIVAVGFVVVLVSVRGDRARTGLLAAGALGAIASVLYVVRVGGDFMHARMLLPGTFLLLTTVAVIPVTRRASLWVTGLVAAAAVLSTVTAVSLRVPYQGGVGPNGIADERGYWVMVAGKPRPVTLADHAGSHFGVYAEKVARLNAAGAHLVVTQAGLPTPHAAVSVLGPSDGPLVFIVGNAGLLGMGAGRTTFTLDTLGLVDALGGHLEPGPPGRAGHEKVESTTWFWARYGASTTKLPPDQGMTPRTVTAARAALRCGELADLVSATTQPMTLHRFWRNLVESPALTSLRVPNDPARARARFCSHG